MYDIIHELLKYENILLKYENILFITVLRKLNYI